ncbi:hypothetical protein Vretimale_15548 [Volvox reticuliferus]|uniref:Uncharacterized protein n=1 Tax=Volvox reticuliferus TaxID=1737510 RepID=A0A8J4GP84_9CHLO|nr:hypothetical protein Vretifemale_15120 [Volvox reticuliferus]GIM12122.1 hypothetical protein Vretimale_15548 [Volvox reticuliferus]
MPSHAIHSSGPMSSSVLNFSSLNSLPFPLPSQYEQPGLDYKYDRSYVHNLRGVIIFSFSASVHPSYCRGFFPGFPPAPFPAFGNAPYLFFFVGNLPPPFRDGPFSPFSPP